MDYSTIGKTINKKRTEMNISQEKLAEMVNLSTSYLGAVERSEKLPSLDVFVRILNTLGISADTALSGVLEVSRVIRASEISEQLSHLSSREQTMVMNVMQTMISDFSK